MPPGDVRRDLASSARPEAQVAYQIRSAVNGYCRQNEVYYLYQILGYRLVREPLEPWNVFSIRLSCPLINQVDPWAEAEAVSRGSLIEMALRDVAAAGRPSKTDEIQPELKLL